MAEPKKHVRKKCQVIGSARNIPNLSNQILNTVPPNRAIGHRTPPASAVESANIGMGVQVISDRNLAVPEWRGYEADVEW